MNGFNKEILFAPKIKGVMCKFDVPFFSLDDDEKNEDCNTYIKNKVTPKFYINKKEDNSRDSYKSNASVEN